MNTEIRWPFFAQKFATLLETRGVTLYRLDEDTPLRSSNLSKVKAGKRRPTDEILRALATYPALNITFDELKGWRAIDEDGVAAMKEGLRAATDLRVLPPPDGFYKVPCRGTVSAGALQLVDEPEDTIFYDWFDIREFSSDLFCLVVKGDSMWPPVPDGAILLVREAKTFRNKGWYVALTDQGESTFKMLEFSQTRMELVPLNPAYPAIKLDGKTIQKAYEVLEYKVVKV